MQIQVLVQMLTLEWYPCESELSKENQRLKLIICTKRKAKVQIRYSNHKSQHPTSIYHDINEKQRKSLKKLKCKSDIQNCKSQHVH